MKITTYKINGTIVNLVTGLLTMVVQVIVSFFLSPYIVKTLGEEANGFTQLANNFVSYATLITIAFNSMAGRFMSVNYHKGDHRKVKEYYNSIIICNIAIILLLIPACAFIIFKLDSIISIGNANLFDVQLLFTCVFLNYFVGLILSIFNMSMFVMNKIYIQNTVNFIRNILNALILLCVFSVLPARMYYVSAVSLFLAVLIVPLYAFMQKKILPELRFEKEYFRLDALKELLKSGIWNTINQCGNMLMTGLDLLLTNLFVDPSSMGILAVSKIFPNAIVTLANVLNNSFAPELTIDWAHGNQNDLLKQLRRSMKISGIILSVPIIAFSSHAVTFYSLWQPTLDPKKLAVLSFLTMMALIPLSRTQVLYNVFTTTNNLKWNSITFVGCGFLNVIIVYFMLKYTSLGVYAVAGVSVIITIIRNIIFVLPYTAKLLHLKPFIFFKEVFWSLVIALGNLIIALVVQCLFNADSWSVLFIDIAVTCIVMVLVDAIVVLNREERNLIIQKFKRRSNNGQN